MATASTRPDENRGGDAPSTGAPRAAPHGAEAADRGDADDPGRWAVFLDFDGVIADIAPTPDSVHVPDGRAETIADLREATGGALALVSGREVHDIRRVFPRYDGAASGGHGAETQWPDGTVERREMDEGAVEAIQAELRAIADTREALLYEPKRLGGVVHYRADPSLEADVRAAVSKLLEGRDDLELQPAKMAFEVKPAGFSKGSVIEGFMARAPFRGRTPFFAGDDVTDEAAFRVVNAMGGVSVKVGEGDTAARKRVEGPDMLFAWLRERLRARGYVSD